MLQSVGGGHNWSCETPSAGLGAFDRESAACPDGGGANEDRAIELDRKGNVLSTHRGVRHKGAVAV